MADAPLEIAYSLQAEDGKRHTFQVRLHPTTLEQVDVEVEGHPDWVNLEVDQCASCPLRAETSPQCPAARSLAALLPEAQSLMSFTRVEAEVRMAGKVVRASTSMQQALSSLVGLCMATSGCPNLAFLKPMARFHVPFASLEETVFRATSSYLLGQYFRQLHTGTGDRGLEGLEEAYRRVHQVNMGIAHRLRRVAEGDANLNAIVRLDMFTHELPYHIGEKLAELAPYFRDYWDDTPSPGEG